MKEVGANKIKGKSRGFIAEVSDGVLFSIFTRMRGSQIGGSYEKYH